MISEESCDTEDWNIDAENSANLCNKCLKYIQIETVIVICNNISQLYCFYSIFDQINAALVNKKLLKNTYFLHIYIFTYLFIYYLKKINPKVLKCSVKGSA